MPLNNYLASGPCENCGAPKERSGFEGAVVWACENDECEIWQQEEERLLDQRARSSARSALLRGESFGSSRRASGGPSFVAHDDRRTTWVVVGLLAASVCAELFSVFGKRR